MKKCVFTIAVLSLLLSLFGCAKYHTRLFQPHDLATNIGPYRLVPRVVAYKNSSGSSVDINSHEYWTSVKLYDTTVTEPDFGDTEFLAQRDSLAQEFLDQVFARIRLDSVALMAVADSTVRTVAPVDSLRHTPRDVNYVTFNFGQIIVPAAVNDALLVVYYRAAGELGEMSSSQEVRLPLYRVEMHRSTFQDLINKESGGFRGNPE